MTVSVTMESPVLGVITSMSIIISVNKREGGREEGTAFSS